MRVFLAGVGTVALVAAAGAGQPTASGELPGRWRVEVTFTESDTHTLRFEAAAGGQGTLLLTDPASSLAPPAEPTGARWERTASGQVTVRGPIAFPIGNVGQDPGTLVLKGALRPADTLSGTAAFFRQGQDLSDPAGLPARKGRFVAKRAP